MTDRAERAFRDAFVARAEATEPRPQSPEGIRLRRASRDACGCGSSRGGVSEAGAQRTLELTIHGGINPDTFRSGLRSIEEIVVVTDGRRSAPHPGHAVPGYLGALVGSLSDDGNVHFPGLGTSVRG